MHKKKNAFTKTEICKKMIARNPQLQERQVENALEIIIHTLKQGLTDGKRIEVRDFGSFKVKHYLPRASRNPRTGEPIHLEDRFRPVFQASKKLRTSVNMLTKANTND